jgi:hypothetical protein
LLKICFNIILPSTPRSLSFRLDTNKVAYIVKQTIFCLKIVPVIRISPCMNFRLLELIMYWFSLIVLTAGNIFRFR